MPSACPQNSSPICICHQQNGDFPSVWQKGCTSHKLLSPGFYFHQGKQSGIEPGMLTARKAVRTAERLTDSNRCAAPGGSAGVVLRGHRAKRNPEPALITEVYMFQAIQNPTMGEHPRKLAKKREKLKRLCSE